MPASPSSPAEAAIGQLASVAQSLAGDGADLLTVLGAIADPRCRRGIRHRLPTILVLAVCAVLAAARSFTAIAEWAADAEETTLAALGVTGAVPSEATFRRTLQHLDADALDAATGAWASRRTLPPAEARRVIAVDGKTLRGSAAGGEEGRHLLAARDHTHGVVLGQVEVDAKTNEIPMLPALLDRIAIRGASSPPTRISAGAIHASGSLPIRSKSARSAASFSSFLTRW